MVTILVNVSHFGFIENFLKLSYYEDLYQVACSYPCLKYVNMFDNKNKLKSMIKPKPGMNWILLYNS